MKVSDLRTWRGQGQGDCCAFWQFKAMVVVSNDVLCVLRGVEEPEDVIENLITQARPCKLCCHLCLCVCCVKRVTLISTLYPTCVSGLSLGVLRIDISVSGLGLLSLRTNLYTYIIDSCGIKTMCRSLFRSHCARACKNPA